MTTTRDLFPDADAETPMPARGLHLFRDLASSKELIPIVETLAASAPFRHFATPGGRRMSAAMTNCGAVGWISDTRGYCYAPVDPATGRAWPVMPARFHALARDAAARAGFAGFDPDVCLINRYEPGTRLGAHQDRDEQDLAAPIVSVSLGLPAVFLWYGERRGGHAHRLPLHDGDVLVFGGPARLGFHGVGTLRGGQHPLTGARRYNLTFRRAR